MRINRAKLLPKLPPLTKDMKEQGLDYNPRDGLGPMADKLAREYDRSQANDRTGAPVHIALVAFTVDTDKGARSTVYRDLGVHVVHWESIEDDDPDVDKYRNDLALRFENRTDQPALPFPEPGGV